MTLLLGLQHVCVQFVGVTFAVILMRVAQAPPDSAQAFISLSMVVGGLATIFQTFKKGPVGSGFLVPEGPDPSFMSASLQALQAGGLPLLAGMTMVAGLFEGVLSQVLYRLRALFPPEVTGLIVAMVGISVIPLAVTDFFGGGETAGAGGMDFTVTALSVLTLITIVGVNLWGPGRSKQFCLIIGMGLGYAVAGGLGLFSGEQVRQVAEAPAVGLPWMPHLRWAFSLALVPSFLIAITCSTLKNVGDITTCQKVNDANWRRVEMRSMRGGVMADALGTFLGGLVGGMGQASYSANIGLSIATGVTSRVVGVATGGILIALAFSPKLAAGFLMMPPFVVGAALVFCISFMVASGMQIITSRMLDARKIFVMGFALIFGLGVNAAPSLFQNVPGALQPVFSSSLSLATVVAIALNVLLRIGLAKRVQLTVTPGPEAVTALYNFMETNGARWGARREVIQRATAAVVEITEALATHQLATGEVEVAVTYDELSVDVEVRYAGAPLDFPRAAPAAGELLEDEAALARLSGFLARQYADSLRAHEKDGLCEVQLHFDH